MLLTQKAFSNMMWDTYLSSALLQEM